MAIELEERQVLKYAPVRVFLRITTASVFLLKGLALGVTTTELNRAMDMLTRAIAALRSGTPDDLHLGSRYATLLEIHLSRIQESFVPAARPHAAATSPKPQGHGASDNKIGYSLTRSDGATGNRETGSIPAISPQMGKGYNDTAIMEPATDMDTDWLNLPIDPSLLPFASHESQGLQFLEESSLDFIWSLDTL